MFDAIVEQATGAGLVDGSVLYTDSIHLNASANKEPCRSGDGRESRGTPAAPARCSPPHLERQRRPSHHSACLVGRTRARRPPSPHTIGAGRSTPAARRPWNDPSPTVERHDRVDQALRTGSRKAALPQSGLASGLAERIKADRPDVLGCGGEQVNWTRTRQRPVGVAVAVQ